MQIVSVLGLLGICAWEDFRKKQLHVVTILGFAIFGILLHLCLQKLTLQDMAGGMAIGGLLFGVSVLSGEKIGKGDALLVLVTGIYLGFWDNLKVLWGGTLLAAVAAFFLVFVKKKGRDYRMPFVPCLLVSYICCLALEGGRW